MHHVECTVQVQEEQAFDTSDIANNLMMLSNGNFSLINNFLFFFLLVFYRHFKFDTNLNLITQFCNMFFIENSQQFFAFQFLKNSFYFY